MFQTSVDTRTVPALWKKAIIPPLAKKNRLQENKDFRSVALTSVVMKCLEKLVVKDPDLMWVLSWILTSWLINVREAQMMLTGLTGAPGGGTPRKARVLC